MVLNRNNIPCHHLDPVCPDYIFSIKNLTIGSVEEVKSIVRKVWDNVNTTNFLETVYKSAPESVHLLTTANINEFINSMWIEKLDTKGPGNIDTPTYNVYAKGKYIKDDDIWCTLRNYLADQE